MNKELCIKAFNEIILYYDTRSKKHEKSQGCVQEMPHIISKLKIVTVLLISDHDWAKNEITVTAVCHGFTQLAVSQKTSKSVTYHQLSWTLCLCLNTLINVTNVAITVSIVSPLWLHCCVQSQCLPNKFIPMQYDSSLQSYTNSHRHFPVRLALKEV